MSKQVLLDRRGFLRGGASVAMAAVLGSSETLAAEAGEKPKIRPLEGKMDYESIRKRAREMMMPRCYVCPECNGRGALRRSGSRFRRHGRKPRLPGQL